MTKLDLAKGFYQVEVEAQSREKTAFVCPFGKYEFTRMPFGLKNAPALFQRCMEVVLQGCYSFSAPYIDDVLVFSEDPGEHAGHLRQVVKELSRHGMTVKESKCVFGTKNNYNYNYNSVNDKVRSLLPRQFAQYAKATLSK